MHRTIAPDPVRGTTPVVTGEDRQRGHYVHTPPQDRDTGPRPPCPACGADDVLVWICRQRHDPPWMLRWLRAVTHAYGTHVYVCDACGDIVLLPA